MGKRCAYCGHESKMTREHIWPKSFLERTDYKVRYTESAGKVFSGDMTIKDVCGICNNGVLSGLDDYAAKLYDQYFAKFERARSEMDFEYDFGRLARWLLKISYNASRGSGIDSDLLANYIPAIISDYDCSPAHVIIFVGRIQPARMKTGVLMKPLGARCGRTIVADGRYDRWCVTRAVTINSYIFSILIARDIAADAREYIGIANHLYGVPLQPVGRVVIPPPRMDTLQAMAGVESWPTSKSSPITK